MAVTTFIPELWSGGLLAHLDKRHVFAGLVNRDYEGMIRQSGDTVHINTLGDIAMRDYVVGTDITVDDLATTDQTLVIDQQKYFNFRLDDVDKAQAAGDLMNAAMQRAGYALADVTDQFVAKTMADAAGIVAGLGVDGTPIALTAANVYEYVLKVKTAMDKANVPYDGRFMVVPPEFVALLLQDDRFVKTGSPQAEDRLVNGWVGRGGGFDFYESNNVYQKTAGKYSIVASTPMTTTYAEQILETEAYRPERGFRDAIKGLHVYGAKVTYPAAVARLIATFA